MPKIGLYLEWPVANTKTKRKNNDQKTLNGPKNVNFHIFLNAFELFLF